MDVRLPNLGEGADSGTVVSLAVKEGDLIALGQTILELETGKAVAPIPSPAAGTIRSLAVQQGAKISVGQLILSLETSESALEKSESAPAPEPASNGQARPAAPSSEEAKKPATPEKPAGAPKQTAAAKAGFPPPAAPSLRKLARDLGIDLERVHGSESGGRIVLGDIRAYLQRLQERTAKRGILPTYFELAFGRASQASDPESSAEYLKLKREHETALVQGQIDRVDVNEDERVAVAYDYKLSYGAKLDDIESGRQVQIPIYLAALEQLFLKGFDLVGGGYYRLRGTGGRLNQGLYRATFADYTHVKSPKTKLDDIEWNRIRKEVGQLVWEFIDGMRAGEFRVKPSLGKVTCKFCDYSAVCRYDPYRISRKRS